MFDTPYPLLESARALQSLVREHARAGERIRRLPDPLVEAFSAAGFFRTCAPKSVGGFESEPLQLLRLIEEISRFDGSAGWVIDLNASCSFFGGLLPLAGARELFSDPKAAVGGIVNPMNGRAALADGGYRVSGRWTFASTCNHAAWMGTSALVFSGDEMQFGPNGPQVVIPFVPSSSFKIVDTWHASGLRGTGSHDITVDDVFVPEHRVIKMMPKPFDDAPLYRFPLFGLFAAANASVALGAARGALDEIARIAGTKTPFGEMSTLSNRKSAQSAYGEAVAILRAGRAGLYEATDDLWEHVSKNGAVTLEQRANYRLAACAAVQCAVRATDLAYATGGGSALYDDSPLQRCFRDVHAITQHAAVAAPIVELGGAALLGTADHPLL